MILFRYLFPGVSIVLLLACQHQSVPREADQTTRFTKADFYLPAPKPPAESKKGSPLVFANAYQLDINPEAHGRWRVNAGFAIWEFKIIAAAPSSFNFAFRDVRFTANARLEVVDENGEPSGGTYTYQDNKPHGQLWTGQVNGRYALIRLSLPENERKENKLILWRVNQGVGR